MSDGSGDRQTETETSGEASDADAGEHVGTRPEGDRPTDPADLLEEIDDSAAARILEEGPVEVGDLDPGEGLRGRVERLPAETIATTLLALGRTVEHLDTTVTEQRERATDLEDRLRRKQAEFKNYKRRQKERMEEERERATEDLVERLLAVRDNLQRALDTDESADIRGGIESTLAQFDRELDRENVEIIEPAPGDAVDPGRHEVLATVPSGQPQDAIADIHRPGYEMAGKVLRPAQVTVSTGTGGDGTDGSDDGTVTGDGQPDTEPGVAGDESGHS